MSFRLLKVSALALAAIASAGALSAGPAAAHSTAVTFNFDNMSGAGYTTSSQNASSSQISNYMTWTLQHNSSYSNSVTVTGGIGEQGASSYVGDNHVVGPVIAGKEYPLTLANTNGLVSPADTTKWDAANPPVLSDSNPDGFIKNCTAVDPGSSNGGKSGCGASSSDIFIDFHGLKIFSFSFDFEIFPDGTCSALDATSGPPTTTCGVNNANLPDLEIWSGDNATGTHFGTFYGLAPGAGVNPITCDSTGTTNSTYTKSGAEASTTYATETAPQLICHASYTVSDFTTNTITSLDFMDWPETIGIDNLSVTVGTPEPASIAFLAFGIIGLAAAARRKRATWARLADGTRHT